MYAMGMKLAATLLAGISLCPVLTSAAGMSIEDQAVATSCGQNTCCIPGCYIRVSGYDGCNNGEAGVAGACLSSQSDDIIARGVDNCPDDWNVDWTTVDGVRKLILHNAGGVVDTKTVGTCHPITPSGQCAAQGGGCDVS